jgi:hypothetical protein
MYETGRIACFFAYFDGHAHGDWRGGVECSVILLAPEILQTPCVLENVIAIVFTVYRFKMILMLMSRTLERLSKMKELVQTHALHFRHKHAVLAKLEQHEAKLTDIASKFRVSFH